MTFEDLKVWAERGFPVRVRGQDLFVQCDSVAVSNSRIRDAIVVAERPFRSDIDHARPKWPEGFTARLSEVEILTGADGAKVVVKEKLS